MNNPFTKKAKSLKKFSLVNVVIPKAPIVGILLMISAIITFNTILRIYHGNNYVYPFILCSTLFAFGSMLVNRMAGIQVAMIAAIIIFILLGKN